MLSYFRLSEHCFGFQMRAVTAESLELCLLGNTPLYFQNYVVRAVYNPEQITDLERCKSTQRSGKAISHTWK